MIEVLLVAHAAATLVMVGVIWFVQVVHYPLMARVSASEFAAYEREHQNRTTFVVAPTDPNLKTPIGPGRCRAGFHFPLAALCCTWAARQQRRAGVKTRDNGGTR